MDVYGNYNSVFRLSPLSYPPPFRPKNGWGRGFSLLEVLTVICLIGILSSVALGWYGDSPKDAVEKVINQRNAQEIVSLGVCATMSGAEFVVHNDKQATAVNLIVGTIGQQGLWKGRLFQLTNLRPTDLPGALTFVKFDAGLLLYDPSGGQP
jgi:prepilin-type N-terminal cleavage/methylation domain-containing protein